MKDKASGLFLCHLCIPAFILFDAVQAYQRGIRGGTATALLVMSLVWLIGGLILFGFRRHSWAARLLPQVLLSTIAVLVCVVILETAITLIMPAFGFGLRRIHRPPNVRIAIPKNPLAIPGKTVETVFTTNELGMRGPAVREKEGAYRILAIGGSTTECFSLDDANTWPAVLGTLLSQDGGRRFWVQNVGLSGHASTDHLYMLRTNPVELRGISSLQPPGNLQVIVCSHSGAF
jgi:hypothetical protein